MSSFHTPPTPIIIYIVLYYFSLNFFIRIPCPGLCAMPWCRCDWRCARMGSSCSSQPSPRPVHRQRPHMCSSCRTAWRSFRSNSPCLRRIKSPLNKLSPKLLHSPSTLTNLRCTVDVLDRKHLTQSEEQDFGQGRNQLRCRHKDIDTVLTLRDHIETLHR